MKVALVHDDLTQWGGAERMLLGLSAYFPNAPIYTLVYDRNHSLLNKQFQSRTIFTSSLQKIPFIKYFLKALLPFHPIAFEQFDFSEYDLVISHTTRFAKNLNIKPGTTHISYCLTPPRFLWNFSDQKMSWLISPILSYLRVVDQIAGRKVDFFLANSKNTASRIKKIYQRDSIVLYPYVDLKKFDYKKSFTGDYYLVISRLNKYKKVDQIIKAFNKNKKPLVVVGVGPELKQLKQIAKDNITFYQSVDELLLTRLIAGCRALIVMAEEDFGLTPIEAQAMGKPVIAINKGGTLETIIDDKTGIFFDEQNAESLNQAIELFEKKNFSAEDCLRNAEMFSYQNFLINLELALKRTIV